MKTLDKIGNILLKMCSTLYLFIGWVENSSSTSNSTLFTILTLPVLVWGFNAIITFKSNK